MKKIISVILATLCSCILFASDSNVRLDQIKIRSFIDRQDVIHIQGDRVWFTHIAGEVPGNWGGLKWPTYVNKVKWLPTWDNDPDSDVFRIESPFAALPMMEIRDNISIYLIEPKNASASTVEYPDRANNWTLSIKLDNSENKGACWFVLEISWDDEIKIDRKYRETIVSHIDIPVTPIKPIVPPTKPSPTPTGRR